MNRVIIREIIQSPEQRDGLLGTTFVLRSISSVICFFIITLLAIFIERYPVIQKILFFVGLGILFSTIYYLK